MIAILYSDGILSLKEIQTECKKWLPVCCVPTDIPTIICFNNEETARRFAKRNISNTWNRGYINLAQEDVEWIKNQGWKIEILNFPKIIKNLSFVILEFQEQLSFGYAKKKI